MYKYNTIYPLIFLITVFFSLSWSQPVTKVLVEEFSSTSCGFCPMRTYELKTWGEQSERHIMVTHHSRVNDNMTVEIPGLELGNDYNVFSQPTVFCNRNSFSDSTIKSAVNDGFFANVEAALAEPAQAGISFTTHEWDNNQRIVSGEISVTFTENISGDFRIGLMVIENDVTGGHGRPTMQNGVPSQKTTGVAAYDQKCYDMNWAREKLPDLNINESYLEGYKHYNVARAAPFGSYGKEGVISSPVEAQTPYTTTFSYEVPEHYDTTERGEPVDLDNMHLVAFVARYSDDLNQREILNSEMVELVLETTSLESGINRAFKGGSLVVSFNSQMSNISVNFSLGTSKTLAFSIHRPSGRLVWESPKLEYGAGMHQFLIPAGQFASGVYFVKQDIGSQIRVRKLALMN